jgi:hypothetical protein
VGDETRSASPSTDLEPGSSDPVDFLDAAGDRAGRDVDTLGHVDAVDIDRGMVATLGNASISIAAPAGCHFASSVMCATPEMAWRSTIGIIALDERDDLAEQSPNSSS